MAGRGCQVSAPTFLCLPHGCLPTVPVIEAGYNSHKQPASWAPKPSSGFEWGMGTCLGVSRGESGWEEVSEKQFIFLQHLLMLNVFPRWASSKIQIKSINKDTFCFHLQLSPPRGPQGGEVTAALITGRSPKPLFLGLLAMYERRRVEVLGVVAKPGVHA